MLRHYRSIHEGIKYPCNQCDFQAAGLSNIQKHICIQYKHEGVKYPCNECDFQATTKSSLQRHKQSKHDCTRHPCPQCDYEATGQESLQLHLTAKHSDTLLGEGVAEYLHPLPIITPTRPVVFLPPEIRGEQCIIL